MEQLLIKNVKIIDPANSKDEKGDILITNGVFSKIGGKIQCNDAKVIDGEGLAASPGFVDMHVHLRDPGFTEKEDILSGCKAAAAGGVTSLLCMPNTNPTADCTKVIEYIINKAESTGINVYPAAAITKGLKSEELNDFEQLLSAGAAALSDDGRPVVNSRLMAKAMQKANKLNMPVLAHCEDLFLSEGGKLNEGKISKKLKVKGVPAAAEDCGTAREIALSAAYDVPVHICHVSTKTSVALIRDAKRRGVKVTAETAPHYFSFTEEELLSHDADYRMSPPLRTEEDRLAVIEGIKDGTIDAIATDHAPHTPNEKSDFITAPNGVVGMETSFSAGITYLVSQNYITLNKLIELMSISPSKILKINAGTISEGASADLVLFSSKEKWTVNINKLHGKSKNAVFKGKELFGKVKLTICGGKIVFDDM